MHAHSRVLRVATTGPSGPPSVLRPKTVLHAAYRDVTAPHKKRRSRRLLRAGAGGTVTREGASDAALATRWLQTSRAVRYADNTVERHRACRGRPPTPTATPRVCTRGGPGSPRLQTTDPCRQGCTRGCAPAPRTLHRSRVGPRSRATSFCARASCQEKATENRSRLVAIPPFESIGGLFAARLKHARAEPAARAPTRVPRKKRPRCSGRPVMLS